MTDEALIRQTQLKATGANIHAVKTLIALYRLMHAIGREQEAHEFERELRRFVQGDGRVTSHQAASSALVASGGKEQLPR